jgi:hypothetical protein
MKSNNNNDDDDDDDDDNSNNTAMGSVHARGDTFLTFGLKALTETNTSRLATATEPVIYSTVTVSSQAITHQTTTEQLSFLRGNSPNQPNTTTHNQN